MTMSEVERWGVFEVSLDGGPTAVEFRHADGQSAYAASFTGDDGRQTVRFMPDAEGEWSYELAGRTARLVCTPAADRNRGPVRRAGEDLRWADGSAYHPLTTTWFEQADGPDRWVEARRAIAASPFDRVRLRARRDGLARLDDQVRDLLAIGTGAEIVIPADSGFLTDLVNRLAAYRNVTWCIEGDDARRDWRTEAELVAEHDSGRHPVAVHAAPGAVDPGTPWFTHLSVPLEKDRKSVV